MRLAHIAAPYAEPDDQREKLRGKKPFHRQPPDRVSAPIRSKREQRDEERDERKQGHPTAVVGRCDRVKLPRRHARCNAGCKTRWNAQLGRPFQGTSQARVESVWGRVALS